MTSLCSLPHCAHGGQRTPSCAKPCFKTLLLFLIFSTCPISVQHKVTGTEPRKGASPHVGPRALLTASSWVRGAVTCPTAPSPVLRHVYGPIFHLEIRNSDIIKEPMHRATAFPNAEVSGLDADVELTFLRAHSKYYLLEFSTSLI